MKTEKLQQRMRRATISLLIWTLGWVLSMTVVAFAPRHIWDFAPVYTLIAVAVHLFFGYKMIIANKQNLNAMDELQRKVHFNAMAITLGVSVVFTGLYAMMEDIRLISFEPDPAHVLMVISICYMLSIVVGMRKYH